VYVVLCLIVFGCQYQCNWLPGMTRLRSDLLCVEWDVKPYTLTHSLTPLQPACSTHTSCVVTLAHPLMAALGKSQIPHLVCITFISGINFLFHFAELLLSSWLWTRFTGDSLSPSSWLSVSITLLLRATNVFSINFRTMLIRLTGYFTVFLFSYAQQFLAQLSVCLYAWMLARVIKIIAITL